MWGTILALPQETKLRDPEGLQQLKAGPFQLLSKLLMG